MTREELSRTLMYMERLRMNSYEAETKRQEREMVAEYKRLWETIEPYVRAENPLPLDER